MTSKDSDLRPFEEPQWFETEDNIQLTYEFQRRTNVAKIYPVRAPNGSSVLIVGHHNRLSCYWRGGRTFKRKSRGYSRSQSASQNINDSGDSTEDVMMIDDDEEAEEDGKQSETYELEEEEEELDPTKPFESVFTHLDCPLESPGFHIAFGPVFGDMESQSNREMPPLFHRNAVVALACADGSIHLIRFDLAPEKHKPVSASNAFQHLVLAEPGFSGHNVPRGVDVSWTYDSGPNNVKDDSVIDLNATRQSAQDNIKPKWIVLVASHSAEYSGKLNCFSIHIDGEAFDTAPSLICEEDLPAPAATISFNPSTYPSPLHTQLIVADTRGFIRIFDLEPILRNLSNDDTPQSSWLLTLYCPFESVDISHGSQSFAERRLRLLDSKWAMNGRCILVLLGNGTWGLWDLEGKGPKNENEKPRQRSSRAIPQSISGAAVTPFTLQGRVGSRQSQKHVPDLHSTRSSRTDTKKLAPMTPNTRKSKQGALFRVSDQHDSIPAALSSYSRGGLSISPISSSDQMSEESLLIWYDYDVFWIANLASYWQRAISQMSKSRMPNSGPAYGESPVRISSINTHNELISNVSQAPFDSRQPHRSQQDINRDILVCAEHRLVVLCPIKQQYKAAEELSELFNPPQETSYDAPLRLNDRELLRRGELDIGGVDRMLDDMAAQGGDLDDPFAVSTRPRRVGFAANY